MCPSRTGEKILLKDGLQQFHRPLHQLVLIDGIPSVFSIIFLLILEGRIRCEQKTREIA